MNPRLSVQLDLLRLAAALAVVLAHTNTFFIPELPKILAIHSQEAVSVFFVLSGFVIAWSVGTREQDWRTYAAARSARLYSVAIPALALMLLVDLVGRSINPGWYAGQEFIGGAPTFVALLRTLTFSNEFWFSRTIIGSGSAFWSLGYEVPYYLLFGLVMFLRGPWRIALCLGWALLVGPRILLYLPHWLLGVTAWHMLKDDRPLLSRSTARLALVMVAVAYMVMKSLVGGHVPAQFLWPTVTIALQIAGYHFSVAFLTAVALVAAHQLTRGGRDYPEQVRRVVAWLAGASFTLYLLHLPLIAFAAAVITPHAPLAERIVAMLVMGLVVLAVAAAGERRKRDLMIAVRSIASRLRAVKPEQSAAMRG